MWTPIKKTVDANLLDRAQGDRRRDSLGWLGVFASLGLAVAGTATRASGGTVALVSGTVLAVSVALINWSRLWIRESQEPFQFTFSVGEFKQRAIPPGAESAKTEELLSWLAPDLISSLGERVPRLSFLDEPTTGVGLDRRNSHVHISGWYGIRRASKGDRRDPSRRWQLEIVPQVRLGDEKAAAKQGQIVRYDLGEAPRSKDDTQSSPKLTRDRYRGAFEQVYWSVASQVYAQIGKAVKEKISLLP